MTDRHAGYIVALEKDIREEDAQSIVQAIMMVKGVLAVEPVVANPDQWLAQMKADNIWRERLVQFIIPKKVE